MDNAIKIFLKSGKRRSNYLKNTLLFIKIYWIFSKHYIYLCHRFSCFTLYSKTRNSMLRMTFRQTIFCFTMKNFSLSKGQNWIFNGRCYMSTSPLKKPLESEWLILKRELFIHASETLKKLSHEVSTVSN